MDPGAEEVTVPDDTATATAARAAEDTVLLFLGGPLDGRVEIRDAPGGRPGGGGITGSGHEGTCYGGATATRARRSEDNGG
jgi:hypothetical protein